MRAIQYSRGGVALAEVERRDPGRGEVEIAIRFTGLCGTDLHIVDGHMDARVPRPLIFGHETVGVVSRTGADVTGWAVGGAVSVVPLTSDGSCAVCQAGHQHVCPNMRSLGIDVDGSLQEYWNVPASNLVRLPDHLDLKRGALLEPLAVAIHDLRRGEVVAGDRVAVIGGGPIGALIASIARARGAEVIVSELAQWRRDWLAEAGVRATTPDDAIAAMMDATAGRGADVVFEVSGSAAGAAIATELAAVRGRIVIVGVHDAHREFDLHRVFWREISVIGARVYERADIEVAAAMIGDACFLDRFVSAVFPMDAIDDALAATRSGRAMKVLIGTETRPLRGEDRISSS